ncbi:MAG: LytR/AlgR family response regulator transcription factor [Chitinophagales bacterium]
MITAIIVDDEPYSCESLATLLERYCPNVKLLDICYSAEDALKAIHEQVPTLIFLDIEMPVMNGFEMLQKLPSVNFSIIFTTSYDQYAIKAIRFSALDYLLKPIDREELQKAVQKAIHKSRETSSQQIEMLLEKLQHPLSALNKIAIPTMEGLQMIPVNLIISCASSSNYTILSLKNKEKITASKTLKEMEELLEDFCFLRVHHSFMVNINEVEKYVKGEGGYLIMSDGSNIDISRSRKELLLKTLHHEGE